MLSKSLSLFAGGHRVGAAVAGLLVAPCAYAASCFPQSIAFPQPTLSVSNGVSTCTSGLQNYKLVACTGGGSICLQSFQAAMVDAGAYFKQQGAAAVNFKVTIPAGVYNLSTDPNWKPQLIPLPTASASTAPPPSATQRLTIAGAGSNELSGGTEIITRHQQLTIAATGISHVSVSGIHFATDYAGIGQGLLASTSTVTEIVKGQPHATAAITVQMQNYKAAGFYTLATGFRTGGSFGAGANSGQFLRAYNNTYNASTQTYTPSLSSDENNYAVSFHDICNDAQATSCASGGNSLTSPSLTFLLGPDPGKPLSAQEVTADSWYASLVSAGTPQLLCFREAGANGGFSYIDDRLAPGSDIVFSNLVWTEAAHTQLQAISGVTVTSSKIKREPAAAVGDGTYQAPCLSTDTGAFQIHGPTYGNTITGLTAVATGDDTVAIFDDSGGQGSLPASSITASTIHDSFARAVLVTNPSSDPTPYATSIGISPYVGPGYGGYPYPESPTMCSNAPGADCLTNIYVPCISATQTHGAAPVYCPVKIGPDGS